MEACPDCGSAVIMHNPLTTFWHFECFSMWDEDGDAPVRCYERNHRCKDLQIAALTTEVERLKEGIAAIITRINQPGFEVPSDAIAGALGKLLKGAPHAQ